MIHEEILYEQKISSLLLANGVTAKVAEELSKAVEADVYAIEPKIPYTKRI